MREIASAAVASAVVADLAQAVAWHRQVAALAMAADRAGVATTDLPAVRSRLLGQQGRLAEAAARTGAALPALMPTPSEIAMAAPALGDLTDAAVERTVRTMLSTLDAIDAALASAAPAMSATPAAEPTDRSSTKVESIDVPSTYPPSMSAVTGAAPPGSTPPGSTPPGSVATPFTAGPSSVASTHAPAQAGPAGSAGPAQPAASSAGVPSATVAVTRGRAALRNGLVYAGFALGVLAVQIFLFVVLDEATSLPLFAPLCLLVLPAFAWLAGYLTIGIAFRSPPGTPTPKRNPRLGAVICLLPDLMLCAWVGVLFVANRF